MRYVDDVLVVSTQPVDHPFVLRVILQSLAHFGWTWNERKGQWVSPEVDFLGGKIIAQGLFPRSDLFGRMPALPQPKNQQDFRRLFGLCIQLMTFQGSQYQLLQGLAVMAKS